MKLVSKFADSKKIFFEVCTDNLPESGIEIIDKDIEGSFGSAKIRVFVLKDLILHYTINRFNSITDFNVSIDKDAVVNTLVLNSESGAWNVDYEPYILCPQEVFTNQLFFKGEVSFSAPEKIELFRIFATPGYYLELLQNYGDTFKNIISKINNKYLGNIFPDALLVSPKMKTIIKEVLHYYNQNEFFNRNFIKNKLAEIIHLQLEQIIALADNTKDSRLNSQDIEKITEAKRILTLNYQNPPTIKNLASILATNEFKLKIGFSKIFKTSIYKYVIEVRLQKAIELMYDNHLTLEQISHEVGYANLSHFTRVFKKMKHVAPNNYRKSLSR